MENRGLPEAGSEAAANEWELVIYIYPLIALEGNGSRRCEVRLSSGVPIPTDVQSDAKSTP